jgi:hypothetical protein
MVKIIMIAAIVAVLTTAAAADDKPLGPHSFIVACGIVPGPQSCIWRDGEPLPPLPRPRPKDATAPR